MVLVQCREINYELLESYINVSWYMMHQLLNSIYFYTNTELPILILLPSLLPALLKINWDNLFGIHLFLYSPHIVLSTCYVTTTA